MKRTALKRKYVTVSRQQLLKDLEEEIEGKQEATISRSQLMKDLEQEKKQNFVGPRIPESELQKRLQKAQAGVKAYMNQPGMVKQVYDVAQVFNKYGSPEQLALSSRLFINGILKHTTLGHQKEIVNSAGKILGIDSAYKKFQDKTTKDLEKGLGYLPGEALPMAEKSLGLASSLIPYGLALSGANIATQAIKIPALRVLARGTLAGVATGLMERPSGQDEFIKRVKQIPANVLFFTAFEGLNLTGNQMLKIYKWNKQWKGKTPRKLSAKKIKGLFRKMEMNQAGAGKPLTNAEKDIIETIKGEQGWRKAIRQGWAEQFPHKPKIADIFKAKPTTPTPAPKEKPKAKPEDIKVSTEPVKPGKSLTKYSKRGKFNLQERKAKYVKSLFKTKAINEHSKDAISMHLQREGKLTRYEADQAMELLGKNPTTDDVLYAMSTPGERIKAQEKVENIWQKGRQASKIEKKKSWAKIKQAGEQKIVDVSGNIKSALLKTGDPRAQEAVMHHTVNLGATKASQFAIDEATKNIFKGLSQDQTRKLEKYIISQRTVDIKGYKPGHIRPENQTRLEGLIHSKSVPSEIKKRGDLYFEEFRKINNFLYDNDVITKKVMEEMNSHVYSPTEYRKWLDPTEKIQFGSKVVDVTASGITPFEQRMRTEIKTGIKSLKGGSPEIIEVDAKKLLADSWNRAYGRVFRNRAFNSLYQYAKENPKNGIVRAADYKTGTYSGLVKLKGRVKGKPKAVVMKKDMAKEWVGHYSRVPEATANTIQWLSGSKVLKPMATGPGNPFFALTNFPRDIAHVWLTTDVFSSHLPIFMGQFAKHLARTAKDAFSQTGAYKDYILEGGGLNLLTHQGAISNKLEGVWGKAQMVLGYPGGTSEIWPRLAIRDRVISQGGSPLEGTFEGRNYLDFNQGGEYTRAINHGIPYWQAGTQGSRGVFRAAAREPGKFAWKVAQIGLLTAGLYEAGRQIMGDFYDDIPDDIKQRYWVLPVPFHFKDKDGDKRYLYLKMAKDQGQRFFSSLFENLVRAAKGEEVNTESILRGITDALPLLPQSNIPPTLDAILGFSANKDFWNNEDIWKGSEYVKPAEQYTEYTPTLAKKVGKGFGISPEKLAYSAQQLLTYGNIYTHIFGVGADKLFDQAPDKYKKTIYEKIARTPGIRRVLGTTQPGERLKKTSEKLKREEITKRHMRTRALDNLAKDFWAEKKETGNINELTMRKIRFQIKRAPNDAERKRLWNRFQRSAIVHNIPQKNWWLDTAAQHPELRAQIFWARWQQADKETQERMYRISRIISGFDSKRFRIQLQKIHKRHEK